MSKDYQISPILNHFSYTHLSPELQDVSMPVCALAIELDRMLDDTEDKQVGLRKLLEAKDCFVRSKIESDAKAKQKKKQEERERFRDANIAQRVKPGQYKGGTC